MKARPKKLTEPPFAYAKALCRELRRPVIYHGPGSGGSESLYLVVFPKRKAFECAADFEGCLDALHRRGERQFGYVDAFTGEMSIYGAILET